MQEEQFKDNNKRRPGKELMGNIREGYEYTAFPSSGSYHDTVSRGVKEAKVTKNLPLPPPDSPRPGLG